MSRFGVILVAAGGSRRFGDKHYKKPYANLAGRAVWLHSAELFLNRDDVAQLVVVIAEEDQEDFDRRFGANRAIMGFDVVLGGATRAESVAAGIAKINADVTHVAVHDAARPCVADKSVGEVFAAAAKSGAAILATPVVATLKRASDAPAGPSITETVPRDGLWSAQTPQVFERELLSRAYQAADLSSATDDAQIVERQGVAVTLVEDSPLNLKITTKPDLKLAEQILKVRPAPKPKGLGNPFADDDLWR